MIELTIVLDIPFDLQLRLRFPRLAVIDAGSKSAVLIRYKLILGGCLCRPMFASKKSRDALHRRLCARVCCLQLSRDTNRGINSSLRQAGGFSTENSVRYTDMDIAYDLPL